MSVPRVPPPVVEPRPMLTPGVCSPTSLGTRRTCTSFTSRSDAGDTVGQERPPPCRPPAPFELFVVVFFTCSTRGDAVGDTRSGAVRQAHTSPHVPGFDAGL